MGINKKVSIVRTDTCTAQTGAVFWFIYATPFYRLSPAKGIKNFSALPSVYAMALRRFLGERKALGGRQDPGREVALKV
jgi:hypothetical protein